MLCTYRLELPSWGKKYLLAHHLYLLLCRAIWIIHLHWWQALPADLCICLTPKWTSLISSLSGFLFPPQGLSDLSCGQWAHFPSERSTLPRPQQVSPCKLTLRVTCVFRLVLSTNALGFQGDSPRTMPHPAHPIYNHCFLPSLPWIGESG
jgi:hypothetical protein